MISQGFMERPKIQPFTLWQLAENLRHVQELWWYQIVMNSRTWVYPSETLNRFFRTSAINDLISVWETDEAKKIMKQKHLSSWINITMGQQPQQPQQPWQPQAWWQPPAWLMDEEKIQFA
jgi:hypothetical protein